MSPNAKLVAACALLFSGAIGSCGARSGLDTSPDASAPPDPLPPAAATCVAAVESTDWTDCVDRTVGPRFDPRRLQQIQCENSRAIPACTALVTEYWDCIAAAGTVCQSRATDTGVVHFYLGTERCEAASEAMEDCLRDCNGGWACAGTDGDACTCATISPNAGEGCVSYPTVDESLPQCAPFCTRCP